MSEYFADLDRAKALGLDYAKNGIAAGERPPEESPLSGEWAGAITPKDIWLQLGGSAESFEAAEGWEITDVCDHWEDGYNSAEWPERPDSED